MHDNYYEIINWRTVMDVIQMCCSFSQKRKKNKTSLPMWPVWLTIARNAFLEDLCKSKSKKKECNITLLTLQGGRTAEISAWNLAAEPAETNF